MSRIMNFLNDCLFYLLKMIGIILLKILYHIQAKNRELIPRRGSLIVAANHFSYMDPIVLQAIFPRRLSFMMTERFYKGHGEWFFKFMRCINVKEKGVNIAALRDAVEVLRHNGVIGIFPEGGVSKEGRLQEGNLGIGFLVKKSGAPVVPAFISGTYEALPKGKIVPGISKINIIFGEPMVFENIQGIEDKKGIEEITRQIMEQIKRLSCF